MHNNVKYNVPYMDNTDIIIILLFTILIFIFKFDIKKLIGLKNDC